MQKQNKLKRHYTKRPPIVVTEAMLSKDLRMLAKQQGDITGRYNRKVLISRESWIKLIPYLKRRLNEDGCTYQRLAVELSLAFGGKGSSLSRARVEQQVRWLNTNYTAGIKLKKAKDTYL